MNKPLIHPASDLTLTLLMKNLPQSVLLSGPHGVGLGIIANHIVSTVGGTTLSVLPEKDDKVDIDKGVISVDSIRRLYTQTRAIQTHKLFIIVDYAERMGHQAQNAFLKLLEEPGDGVYFILVTHTPSKLLSTITSRTEQIEIRPITRQQSEAFLDTLITNDPQKRAQLLFMAEGLPAEMTRLSTDDAYFQLRASIVRDARDLLQSSTYKKLLTAQLYKDDREAALALISTAENILRRSISEKPSDSLIHQIDSLLYAHQQIGANGNIRLCLARLVL